MNRKEIRQLYRNFKRYKALRKIKSGGFGKGTKIPEYYTTMKVIPRSKRKNFNVNKCGVLI